MQNKILLGVGIVIALVLGGTYLQSQQSPQDTMMPEPTSVMEKSDDTMNEPTGKMMEEKKLDDGAMMNKESRYLVYSKEAFDAATDKKRVLFFHAPWCPTCKPADAAFEKDSALIPETVVLFKTDYDTSSELKKKYNVTYQHTFVQVDATGKELSKWNGGQLTELTANVK